MGVLPVCTETNPPVCPESVIPKAGRRRSSGTGRVVLTSQVMAKVPCRLLASMLYAFVNRLIALKWR
jgi:hypothetical protein